ncbi:hypothetical protein QCA50_001469 [Cerrena zonata]|uniref:Uncharacterized protein n=1 Tax=Cerrena zonata TaxID=2478898 RepID=A0AAW0GVX3_9APHY
MGFSTIFKCKSLNLVQQLALSDPLYSARRSTSNKLFLQQRPLLPRTIPPRMPRMARHPTSTKRSSYLNVIARIGHLDHSDTVPAQLDVVPPTLARKIAQAGQNAAAEDT